jgi:dihydroorotase
MLRNVARTRRCPVGSFDSLISAMRAFAPEAEASHQMATYDLLIRGGTLIDPASGIHDRRDIAFANGRVATVSKSIPLDESEHVIDARSKLVAPGLVDVHVHVFDGVSHYGIEPDSTCLATGATTVVDAGSAGADTFSGFRKYIIEASETRIFAQVNISAMGMIAGDVGELDDIKWANVPKALDAIERNRDLILGVKVRLSRESIVGKDAGMRPLFLAREAADAAKLPIMVHPQQAWCESLDDILAVMREGDILTHTYHGDTHGILDDDGKIRSSVRAARDRGVVFDVGHGVGSFDWRVVEQAFTQDFTPTTISSDLHRLNLNGPVFDLITTVSKFFHLGLSLDDALAKVTAVPSQLVLKEPKLGNLREGSYGDAVVLDLQEGHFDLVDAFGAVRVANRRLVPTTVVKAGRVYPDVRSVTATR